MCDTISYNEKCLKYLKCDKEFFLTQDIAKFNRKEYQSMAEPPDLELLCTV